MILNKILASIVSSSLLLSLSVFASSGSFTLSYQEHLTKFQDAMTTVEMHEYANQLRLFCKEHLLSLEKTHGKVLADEQTHWWHSYQQSVQQKIDEENKHKGTISSVNLEMFKAQLLKSRIEELYKRYP
jgi:hypothetical protein